MLAVLALVGVWASIWNARGIERLDIGPPCGVVLLSKFSRFCGERDGRPTQARRSESRCPTRGRHAKRGGGTGCRSEVPRGRVLRPTRHRPGEVRAAAPSPRRQRVGDGRRRGVRSVEADVLPDESEVRRGGGCGAGAQEARPSRAAQAPRRCIEFLSSPGCRRRADPSSRARDARSKRVRPRRTPQVDRAGAPRKKNSAVDPRSAEPLPAEDLALDDRYEALRAAALGGALPFDARAGLVVFLRHGMWAWARSVSRIVGRQPTDRRPAAQAPRHSESIHILAAMALLGTNDRRAP